MAQSNTVQINPAFSLSFKPFIAVKDYLLLLVSAFKEAKALEQKTRKTSGNW